MRYVIAKAKKYVVGTIHTWADGRYIKDNEHHWKLLQDVVHDVAKKAGAGPKDHETKLLHTMSKSALEHIKNDPNATPETLHAHLDKHDDGTYEKEDFDGLKHATKAVVSQYVKEHGMKKPEAKAEPEKKIPIYPKPEAKTKLTPPDFLSKWNDDGNNSYYKDLDRYRRHDHGGGPDGDEWLDSEQIDADYRRGEQKYGDYLKTVNKRLEDEGYEGNAGFELGEKGHFSISVTLRPKQRNIQKASGEGSRGGKVIGHTRSGKPIYATYGHSGHKDFTAGDHADAAALHEYNASTRGDFKEAAKDNKKAQSHKYASPKGDIGSVGKEIKKIEGEEGSYSEKEQRFKDHGKKISETAEPPKVKPPIDYEKEAEDLTRKEKEHWEKMQRRAYKEFTGKR